MKNFILLQAMALLVAATSFATSPVDVCSPTYKLNPTVMSCYDEKIHTYYSIEIQTLASGPKCPYSERVEKQTATVDISTVIAVDLSGIIKVGTLHLEDGAFQYELNDMGDSSFYVPTLNLKLKKCVTPVDGTGFSVGN